MSRETQPSMPDTVRSGIAIPTVVTRSMCRDPDQAPPGQYPFTRGIFADGFRGRPWTMRQYSGFGTAEESNERFRFLLEHGQTGLSVALDLPTQIGLDPSDPMARPEIGKVGVSLSNLAEMELLFDNIDLGKVSTSFTINGTAAIIYAMYLACADNKGIPRSKLTGTTQNDILKEYVARGTWIFPVRPSMRLIADTVFYSNDNTPRFNPISIAGAHARDAGCTAAEEIAYTLANAIAYVDELLRRGGNANHFAQRLSFFFYVHMDVFEEIAKFRAARRIWAHTMKERYGVTEPKAQVFRFGVVCGGSSLVAPQPYNNVIRVSIEALAAVLGGAQSIFTCAYDEPFQIPTESSAELALRTQQILAYESGIARTVDPLGGSYFVEWLTDQMEDQIVEIMQEVERYGGAVRGIEDGWLQLRIALRAHQRKKDIDSGARPIVGLNCFTHVEQVEAPGEYFVHDPEVSKRILEKLGAVKDRRSNAAVEVALRRLHEAAIRDDENLIPYLIECCHAYVTVGEMIQCLRRLWGDFKEPVRL
ncbi:MAG: methylmalonyl-CoA mutase [Gammaproteobacteria bacterium]|nr:MAG: methylmalonyl-CoA mutase [Gammaproteobacteria bacterium]